MRRIVRILTVAALLCALAQLGAGVSFAGQSAGYWPDDPADQELKAADGKVLDLQRKRFRALFSNDKKEVERLNKEFRSAQKERRELLRATGRQ